MPYKDPIKQKEAQRRHYLNNREKYKRSSKKSRADKINWLLDLKDGMQCSKCGESRGLCLDFHHLDPKEKEMTISRMMFYYSKEKILEEISKCDVLCANCHRIEHWELNGKNRAGA